MSTNASSNVRVVLRIRPFIPGEIDPKKEIPVVSCVTAVDNDEFNSSGGEVTVQIKDQLSSRNECYKLDSFYDQDNNLLPIFQHECERKVIPEIFHGSNGTIFAYGATGSGKTYTMQGTDEHPGLVPLALSSIFSTSKIAGVGSVEISYYEVYLDRCYDLLEPKAKEIVVLEDKDGNIQLKGLSRISVGSMEDFHQLFSCGVQRRKVAHTGLNDASSRSHGILSIFVSSKTKSGAFVTGKLNLIDLAGNEDSRRTCNEEIRLLESAKINQSLFALSNVIYALNNNEARVPYRENKLTRILQDSLGGPNQALMIACLNPGSYTEAVHTVGLAARSRHVVNYSKGGQKLETPRVKVDMEEKLRIWLESKRKSRSTQKIFSSCGGLGKTPKSKSCRKRTDAASNRITNDQGSVVSRKLFDAAVIPKVAAVEVEFHRETLSPVNSNASAPIKNFRFNREVLPPSSSVRKVLSRLNSNTTTTTTPPPVKNFTSDREVSCDNTPLDKFNARGSNLKDSLAKEYLEFLNVASKEELLLLKGIGPKRAENIIALRDDSPQPFKSIYDLEKIGLSSKQVKDVFVSAATGMLFD